MTQKLAVVDNKTKEVVNIVTPWQPPKGTKTVPIKKADKVDIGYLVDAKGKFKKSPAILEKEAKKRAAQEFKKKDK